MSGRLLPCRQLADVSRFEQSVELLPRPGFVASAQLVASAPIPWRSLTPRYQHPLNDLSNNPPRIPQGPPILDGAPGGQKKVSPVAAWGPSGGRVGSSRRLGDCAPGRPERSHLPRARTKTLRRRRRHHRWHRSPRLCHLLCSSCRGLHRLSGRLDTGLPSYRTCAPPALASSARTSTPSAAATGAAQSASRQTRVSFAATAPVDAGLGRHLHVDDEFIAGDRREPGASFATAAGAVRHCLGCIVELNSNRVALVLLEVVVVRNSVGNELSCANSRAGVPIGKLRGARIVALVIKRQRRIGKVLRPRGDLVGGGRRLLAC